MRWFILIAGVLLGATAGFWVAYSRWGQSAAQVEQAERQLQATKSEFTALYAEKQQLEQRLQQVQKEQERLAQENEILHQQRATAEVLGQPGGELPERPPK